MAFSLRASIIVGSLWLAVLGTTAAFLARVGLTERLVPSLLEATLYCGLLLLLVSTRLVQRTLGALPAWQRACLVGLAFLSLCAQEFQARPLTYPFVDWRMYSHATADTRLQFLQYDGLRASGRRQAVAPGGLVPALDEWRLYGALERLDRASDGADLFERVLRAAARVDRRRNPDDPLAAIEVFRVEMDTRTFRSDLPLERQLVRRIELDPGIR